MPEPTLHQRLVAAYRRLHELAPDIYSAEYIQRADDAAKKIQDSELLYFVLSAESTVKRKEARESGREYQRSDLGRTLKDAGAFRFYTVDQFPHEREED